MPRVLLLATTTGYQTRAFGEAAERLGVQLVFATDRCHLLEDPWQDGAIAIRFHDEEASVEAIVDAAATSPIDGLISVGDRPTVIAARVADRLGLPGHPVEAASVARDKQKTRERLRDAGLPVPWFAAFRADAHVPELAHAAPFPCVIKPVALSASRGVMRADDGDQLVAAFGRLRALLGSPDVRAERNDAHDRLLIEGFIPGREFALEGLLHHGVLHVLALFDKPDPLDGPFFEETIYLTPSSLSADAQQRVVDGVTRALTAIGLRHGPIHAECRVNDEGVFVLEVAARPIGGLCAGALRFEATDQVRLKPDTTYERPDSTSERPDTTSERPDTTSERPDSTSERPDSTSERPDSTSERPDTTSERPDSTSERPDSTSERPDSTSERPDSTSERPDSTYVASAFRRTAISLEELLLRHALGESPDDWSREPAASGVMMIPIPARGVYRGVSGVEAAQAVAGIDRVAITAKPEQLLVPLPEGASYLGFIFARGGSSEAVEQSLRVAHARLQFVIDPELRVVQSRHGAM